MKSRRVLTLLLVALLLVSAAVVLAETNLFEIGRWSINAGSETMTGGSYLLSGTAGDVSAGPAMSGDAYVLSGGFWPAQEDDQEHELYVPLIMGQ